MSLKINSLLQLLIGCLFTINTAAQSDLRSEKEIINQLNKLAAQRLELMPLVAANKWRDNKPVTDTARERQVLNNVRLQALSLGLNADSLERFFVVQISKASALQEEKIAEWKQSGCKECQSVPSLDSLRRALDILSIEMMRSAQLAAPYLNWLDRQPKK
jgi:chorismate mutase-like protein